MWFFLYQLPALLNLNNKQDNYLVQALHVRSLRVLRLVPGLSAALRFPFFNQEKEHPLSVSLQPG